MRAWRKLLLLDHRSTNSPVQKRKNRERSVFGGPNFRQKYPGGRRLCNNRWCWLARVGATDLRQRYNERQAALQTSVQETLRANETVLSCSANNRLTTGDTNQ